MKKRIRIPKYPTHILTRCELCGEVHMLRVIRLLSSAKNHRYCVFCKNNFKFYTFYKDLRHDNKRH